MNDNQSITSGIDRIITCPITPTGNSRNAVAITNGGHITPFVNIGIQICNIGHNRHGAFGDGNDEQGDYGVYTCLLIPGSPKICGTAEADLELLKTVNELSSTIGSEVVFTITVINKGPNDSSGSSVRDQLTSGFQYLSDDSDGMYNSSTGLWNVGPLAVGDSLDLNITARILSSGEYTNYAQILFDADVDPDSTPGDDSIDQDDNASLVMDVEPCPNDAICLALESISIDDCNSIIPAIYNAENAEGEIEDIFGRLLTCGIAGIYHEDDTIVGNTCSFITRTYWLTDDENEVFSCSRDFTFEPDTEGPMVTCPIDIILSCNEPFPDYQSSLEGSDYCSDAISFSVIGAEDEILTVDFCETTNAIADRIYTAIDECDNISTCTQRIIFERDFIYIPNIFSPSSNDNLWTVFPSSNINILECNVYDRWGNLVYISNGVTPAWGGRSNGRENNQGVYVYIISYQDSTGEVQIVSGDITLIR